MKQRRDVHGIYDHDAQGGGCHDAWCCACECRACKRAWFAAGRPSPEDCPDHGREQVKRPTPPTLEERVAFLERAVEALLRLHTADVRQELRALLADLGEMRELTATPKPDRA